MAEISKSVAHVLAIALAKVCCKNTVGDSKAGKSCNNQSQGAIVPAIANSKYSDFIELNGTLVEV